MADENVDDVVSDESDPSTKATETKPTERSAAELEAELARTKKALAAANAESAKHRIRAKRLEEIEEEERKKEEAKLGDDEKRKRQLAELSDRTRVIEAEKEALSRQLLEVRMERAIEAEARVQKAASPAKITRLVDRTAIQFDAETGKFVGLGDAVKAVFKEYPDELADGMRRGGGTPARELGQPPRAPAAGPRGEIDPIVANQQSLAGRITYDF